MKFGGILLLLIFMLSACSFNEPIKELTKEQKLAIEEQEKLAEEERIRIETEMDKQDQEKRLHMRDVFQNGLKPGMTKKEVDEAFGQEGKYIDIIGEWSYSKYTYKPPGANYIIICRFDKEESALISEEFKLASWTTEPLLDE